MAALNGNVQDEAFVTLATNDVYARGALVLAESLKMHGTKRNLVVMITPQVTHLTRTALNEVFDVVKSVDVMDSKDEAHLALLKRPELGITFTKLHCWTLTEYRKCVFMDADMMALQNIDDLFEREELSAVRDSGWPDIFNSGLFVFRPSIDTFDKILQLAEKEGSFDGGDQGLLNSFFSDWSTKDLSRHIPFLYNLHVTASYTYLPAFKKFGKDTKVVHFIGSVKPWHHVYKKSTGGVQRVSGPFQKEHHQIPQFLGQWWSIYLERCQKYFSEEQEMNDEVCNDLENQPTATKENQINRELPQTFFETALLSSSRAPGGQLITARHEECLDEAASSNPHDVTVHYESPAITVTPAHTEKQWNDRISPTMLSKTHKKTSENSPLHDISSNQTGLKHRNAEETPSSSTVASSPEDALRSKWEHKSRWESGNVDYTGEDKFENIQALLDTYL